LSQDIAIQISVITNINGNFKMLATSSKLLYQYALNFQ